MRILAYRGISLISKAIKWQTRSQYSHIGVELSTDEVIEAWHRGGVVASSDFREIHTPSTRVDAFSINKPFLESSVELYLKAEIGKKYDWRGVSRFVSRRDGHHPDKWFCSELAAYAFERAGCPLIHLPSWKCSPRDIAASPILKYDGYRIC